MNNVNNQNERSYSDLALGNVTITWSIFTLHCKVSHPYFSLNFFNFSINSALKHIYQNFHEVVIMSKYSIIFRAQTKCRHTGICFSKKKKTRSFMYVFLKNNFTVYIHWVHISFLFACYLKKQLCKFNLLSGLQHFCAKRSKWKIKESCGVDNYPLPSRGR